MRVLLPFVLLAAVAGCGRTGLFRDVSLPDSGSIQPGPPRFTQTPPGCTATARPFVESVFGRGFQSDQGSGASRTIDVEFSCRTTQVAVTALDADFPVSALVAFDGFDNEVGRVEFPFDNRPGELTAERREVRAPDIARVELRPASADLVAWELLVAE